MELFKDRILRFIEHEGLSIREFERKCGFSNGYFNKIKDFSKQKVEEIAKVFPNLNYVWVLTGETCMLNSDQPAKGSINQRIQKLIEIRHDGNFQGLAKLAGIRPSTLKDIVGEKSITPEYDTIIKILEAESKSLFPPISSDWLLRGIGPMECISEYPIDSKSVAQTQVENITVNFKLVPLLNLDAVGGMHSLNAVSGSQEYTEKLIPFTDAQEGDVALVVSGNSMDPTCPAGSKVLLREVVNWNEYFGFGNIFVIHLTDNRRILKEVQKYPEDPKNYVLCKSHNDKYPEEELPKNMIKSVWKVVKILNERGW